MNINENWEDIKFFLALAKTGKLQRAAKLIKSNHTTVYRRIKNFEERFNVQLFESTSEGYLMTSAGEDLLRKVEGLEDRMNDIFGSIQGLDNTVKGRVTLTTTHSIAATVLPKILLKLNSQWPSLEIDLKVSNQFFNLTNREADIAIRPSSDVPEHLIGRKVGQIDFGLFASKEYIRQFKTKKGLLKHLEDRNFIGLDNSLSHLKSCKWFNQMVSEDSQVLRVDNVNIMGKMCAEGLGLAVLPTYYKKTFKNLELVLMPEEFIGSDLWILTHKSISKTPRIKTCTEFLFKELKKI